MVEMVGEVNHDAVIEQLEAHLAGPAAPERETWGTSPAYVAEQRTIMSNHGPPPGWADKMRKDQPSPS